MSATSAHPQPSPGRSRPLSAAEFLLGASIVIAYNVFKAIPNEVLILFPLGLLSIWLRGGGWRALGLKRPESWARVLQIALGAAALRILLGEFVTDPLTRRFWPQPQEVPSGFDQLAGDLPMTLGALAIVWIFAAFGEEFGYRGYLLLRFADLGKGSAAAYWAGVVLVAVLFGVGHYWKGPGGMIDSGMAGLVLGAAFLLSGRNLWACILAHGFIDTFGVVWLYMGWPS